MAAPLPGWSEDAFSDHRLYGPTDAFIDESGPREDKTCTLGVFLTISELADHAKSRLDALAAELEREHEALTAASYDGEWKGRMLARSPITRRERRAINAGELLSAVSRQVVYARCLNSVRTMPGCAALCVTYEWTGPERGPEAISGYRIRRIIQFAFSALRFHGVSLRRAYIDDGHAAHYSAGIEEFAAATGLGALPHEFVDSATDRRIQLADLIAFAGHACRFPTTKNMFPTVPGWLAGFVGEHLLTLGNATDHYVIEP